MPMPEKILDEKAEPKKTCEDLVSNQTAPASGMSNKVDEIVSDTKRLSIEEKVEEQVPENKPAELKETKSKLTVPPVDEAKAAETVEAKPVEAMEAKTDEVVVQDGSKTKDAEVKPSELSAGSDSKKRSHAEITNNDIEMQQ